MVGLTENCVGGNTDIEVMSSINFLKIDASWLGIPFERLKQEHFEQILWELHKLCSHHELSALDHCARLYTPYESDPNAETLLMQCFPNNSFAIPTLDTANHEIASLSH